MDLLAEQLETSRDMDFLHEIGHRLAAADPIESIMDRVLDFIADLVRCDSCLVYIAQGEKLVLRASRNPHSDLLNRLGLHMGEGITGWVAEHRQTVAIARHAWTDARFLMFNDLPEDRFEAFLSVPILCRSRVVGVINLQHRQPHHHTEREIRVITTIGFLVGAELELARIESERMEMQRQLETRKIMERAKGIIQRQLQVDEENAYLTLQKLSRQKRRPHPRDRGSHHPRRRAARNPGVALASTVALARPFVCHSVRNLLLYLLQAGASVRQQPDN